ncbi:MAG TPA: hypothetical protein DCR24_11950 [Bacillus bacterium]|nr:hypothetical protein [Bacillus sp. (in: firmicutes)]
MKNSTKAFVNFDALSNEVKIGSFTDFYGIFAVEHFEAGLVCERFLQTQVMIYAKENTNT